MTADNKDRLWTIAQSVFGFLMACLVGLVNYQMTTIATNAKEMQKELGIVSVSIAEVKKELDTVKPRDVLAAVHETSRKMVTRDELRSAIKETAPWSIERDSWQRWRSEVEGRLRALETK